MRRAALILCLLLLAPVSGAWSLPELPPFEEEWVVVREDGWTHDDWVALRSDGLEPLRQISVTEVLVWGDHGTYKPDMEVVLRGPFADGYRVVLEPRLPSDAQWGILSTFEYEMLQLAGMNSVLPTSFEVYGINPSVFDAVPGIWWVEPLLETKARNDLSSSIMENGSMEGHPAWNLGLNGSGVIIGVADSGIELDHGCFRENATDIGEIGVDHRKVVLVNTSIDGGDHSGQADYKHGTHIAGSLVCDMWNGTVGEGTSPSHGARLLFQDVVNESGWSEPSIDWLLAEAVANGVIIHSDSWGDDTEAYTLRSAEFDLWHREMPWSLAFIAPGNNPSKFYEPANARNVVSVGGTMSDNSTNLYPSSSTGPTEEGLRGNFIVAPAVGIVSANADGNVSSFNDDMRSSTGTSMSTPLGASITAVIQQMVQEGWFTDDGFVPSGPQLRALLALSSDSLPDGLPPDEQQGWGRPNLANLVNYDQNSSGNIWIHDSYMHLSENARMLTVEQMLGDPNEGARPLERVISSRYSGLYAGGPFLKQGEQADWDLEVVPGEDLEVILSFNQRPFGSVSDDLNVSVILPNGTIVESGEALEGTEHVYLPASYLSDVEYVTIQVDAEVIGVGNVSDALGSDGDMMGFALAVKGVSGAYVVPEPEPGPDECEDGTTFESGCTECPPGEEFVVNAFQCLPIPPEPEPEPEPEPIISGTYQISGYDECTRECESMSEDRHELRVTHSDGTVLCSVILDHESDDTGATFVACPDISLTSGSIDVEIDAGYGGHDWVVTIVTPSGTVTTYNWRFLHDNGWYRTYDWKPWERGTDCSDWLRGCGCWWGDKADCMEGWQTLVTFSADDEDGDGFENDVDDCPNQFGLSTSLSLGCPDGDHDGLADFEDAAPDDANEVSDGDEDGIGDNRDACPEIYGNSTEGGAGCPDSDGDGWSDQDEVACGSDPASTSGYVPRDSDNDGLCDAVDPDDDNDGATDIEEMEGYCRGYHSTNRFGYDEDCKSNPLDPDSDYDGFLDGSDGCPQVASSNNDGCPVDQGPFFFFWGWVAAVVICVILILIYVYKKELEWTNQSARGFLVRRGAAALVGVGLGSVFGPAGMAIGGAIGYRIGHNIAVKEELDDATLTDTYGMGDVDYDDPYDVAAATFAGAVVGGIGAAGLGKAGGAQAAAFGLGAVAANVEEVVKKGDEEKITVDAILDERYVGHLEGAKKPVIISEEEE